MKSEWRTVALGSVADLTVGFVGTMANIGVQGVQTR